MNDFPFSPFFEILERDGFRITIRDYRRVAAALRSSGPWTAKPLRTVLMSLLVRDQDQKDLFLRRFDDFFELEPATRIADIDMARAISELESLAENEIPPKPPIRRQTVRPPHSGPDTPDYKPRRLFLITLIILLVAACGLFVFVHFQKITPDPVATPTPVPSPTPAPIPTERPDMRIYETLPHITVRYTEPPILSRDWTRFVGVTGTLMAVLLAFALFVRKKTKIPDDKAPEWDANAPRHYRLGQIGGALPPRLNAETLDFLADFLGYFQSTHPGRDLDIDLSVKTTLDKGIPTPVFERRKEIYTVLVLEDAFCDQTEWDPIACELAKGLGKRGVPVIYGRFEGTPSVFHTDDGSVHILDDIEDRRGEFLLLVFSDGRHVHRRNDAFALESIARWPMKAWLAYQDSWFGNVATCRVAKSGIPVYPATPEGLAQAMGVFLTESGRTGTSEPLSEPGPGAPVGNISPWQLERCLGDAQAWAMDCAMVRPITVSLAESLRREFHSLIPYARMGRLLGLPKTTLASSGIWFDDTVLAILRTHFAERRSHEDQERVLRFLLKKIKAAEPKKKTGAAWLAWNFHYQRVRLEIEPKPALKELAKLAADKSPIKDFVTSEMSKSDPDAPVIPLRVQPQDPVSRYRLEKMTRQTGKPVSRFPLSQANKTVASVLLFVLLAAAAWTGKTVWTANPEIRKITMANPAQYPVRLEIKAGDGWKTAQNLSESGVFEINPMNTYRISVLNAGRERTQLLDGTKGTIQVDVGSKTGEKRACEEIDENIGLTIIRCPKTADPEQEFMSRSWREKVADTAPKNRLVSIGIVGGQDSRNLERFRYADTLLKTSSVDVVYFSALGKDGKPHFEETMRRVFDDLGGWADQAQIFVLADYWNAELSDLAENRKIGRLLALGFPSKEMGEFENLFAFAENQILPEAELTSLKWPVLAATGEPDSMLLARGDVIRLRSKPMELSDDDVKAMLKKYKFFDNYRNETGDFKNAFRDNGDGTVTDYATGLMWQQAGSKDWIVYKDVPGYVKKINQEKLAGHDDWRLPTIEELASLLEKEKKNELYIDPIFDQEQWWCWSSDKRAGGGVWNVDFDLGIVNWYYENNDFNVRLVRRGQ